MKTHEEFHKKQDSRLSNLSEYIAEPSSGAASDLAQVKISLYEVYQAKCWLGTVHARVEQKQASAVNNPKVLAFNSVMSNNGGSAKKQKD